MEHILPPRAPSEQEIGDWIARHLAEKLGTEPAQISPQAPFESFGLPISEAMVLRSGLQSWLGRRLPPTLLLEYDTIEKLARHLALTAAETPEPVAAQAAPAEAVLSLAQERLWVLEQLAPGTSLYTIPDLSLRLTGPLDLTALAASLSEIARRHETLRMTFQEVAGRAVPVIAAPQPIEVVPIDLKDLPVDAREDAARARLTAAFAQPFDLVAGPLWRPILLRLAPEEHILALPLHHLIADGWSLGVLLRELEVLYTGYCQGGQPELPELPELPLQYTAFAARQRQQLQGSGAQELLDFWRNELAGATEPLALPCDYPRPAAASYRGRRHRFILPADLAADLKRLAQEHNVSLFTALFAAFQTLLFRYTGQEDFIVGVPTHGRRNADLQPLVGLFVNTVPLRCDLSGAPTFATLLARVNARRRRSFEHQDLPFQQMIVELQTERDLSRAPLFQMMFALQNWPLPIPVLPSLQVATVPVDNGVAQYDLTMHLAELEGNFVAVLEYSADLFQAATIARMAGHFLTLLAGIVADPEQKITHLPLLTPAERKLLLEDWNQGGNGTNHDRCIHQLIEDAAASRPAATAVICGEEQFTYTELDRRANQLAHWLQSVNVEPEQFVGICMERSPEMIVAILAVLKAGAAYLPLDPGYPAQRLAFVLNDTGVAVVLTQDHLVGRLPHPPAHVLRLDADWAHVASFPADRPPQRATPENLAYVIYTSGSTGEPKGVLVENRNLVHSTAARFTYYRKPVDTFLLLSPIVFDSSIAGLFWTLCQAGKLVLPFPNEERDPASLARLIQRHQVTHLLCLPTLYDLILAYADPIQLASLKAVIVAGEVCPPELVAQHLERLPFVKMHNEYGPTEGTVWDTVYEMEAHSREQWQRRVPIGRPITGSQVYVLDAQRQPVPIGVPGELYIGGAGVARGYLNRPDLTAERFVEHDLAEAGRVRLYRTGDLGRYLADGNIEYLGRSDHQVKVRGYRIEPEEIEGVLRRHAMVRGVAVVAHRVQLDEMRLVAYVVPEDGAEPSAEALTSWMRQQLPEYMLPAAIFFIGEIPLLPTGKVDRSALPAPEFGQEAGRPPFVAPRNDLEQRIATMWGELLGVKRIGVHDNFFELGGHSLLAARCMARISADLALELPLRLLFDRPTVAGLAERLAALLQQRTDPTGAPILRRQNPGEPVPLSFSQQRLWFLQRLEPESPAYNVPTALKLHGVLDVSALRCSLAEIVRRHEALRTTFQIIDGQPFQVIGPEARYSFETSDISQLSSETLEAEISCRAREEAQQPFDLEAGPLLRIQLLQLATDEHVLLLTLHHIVSDGWSAEVLIRELTALYGSYAAGAGSLLPELAVQYADYALWQRERLAGGLQAKQLAYWKEQLGDKPPVLELPTDHVRPAQPSYRGDSVEFEIPTGLLAKLHDLCLQEGATDFMGLAAVFQALLYRYSEQERISVGTPVANRTRRETEELVGFFVNTLVLCTDFSGQPSFRAVLRRLRTVALEAYDHQELPFELLVEELHPPRDTGRSPLFQAMFVLQDDSVGELRLPGLSAVQLRLPTATTKFDLTLIIERTRERVTGTLEYSTELFAAGTMERLARHYVTLLESVVADPDGKVALQPLLSAEERRQVLVAWNPRGATIGDGRCIHELIEAVAATRPRAQAVVCGAEQISYGELEARANQLAHWLQEAGVGPETRVGICLERSAASLVAILGVLKAGAAYLPLDPGYPAQRLAFMLADTRAMVILTQDHLVERLPAHSARVLRLDADWAHVASFPADRPPQRATPENLAYVIYTSGSTGEPKGVLVENRNLVHSTAARFTYYRQPVDTFLLLSPIVFDSSIAGLFWTLCQAGKLVLPFPDEERDPASLARLIQRHQVTHLLCLPTLYDLILAYADPIQLASLEAVIVAGEVCPPELVAQHLERLPFVKMYNEYGPTEGTVWGTVYEMEAHSREQWQQRVPIGRPITGSQVYVLDAQRQPVPIGVPGELYIGGAGVARGYLNRPDLTAERFVEHDLAEAGRVRLYRTGDLGRHLADGNIEYLGRSDHQVKVRGYRIEPEEIEGVLRRHAMVRGVAVVAHRDQLDEMRLVAYVVPEDRAEPSAEALTSWMRQQLPEYMLPAAIFFIGELPLLPTGKVDRDALPAPEFGQGAGRPPFVAPRNDLEQRIATMWGELLGVERIGVHDNFFELGGHSLLAARCMARISADLALELPLRLLFDRPTVAGLAERLAALLLMTGQAIQMPLSDTSDREEGIL